MDAPKTVIDITLDVLTVFFQGAAFLVVGTTDKCAPLGKAVDFSPVSSFGSCSPVSYLLFSWISPVLATGAKVVSLSADDLPYLGANDRADNLWDSFRSEQGKKGPRWINPLLWRCLKVNRRMFYWRESHPSPRRFISDPPRRRIFPRTRHFLPIVRILRRGTELS